MRVTSSKRSARGANVIEIGVTAFIMLIVALLCMNAGIIVLGSCNLERACRNAARAAAQCDNPASALQAAQAITASDALNSIWFTGPVVEVAQTSYQDFGGTPPSPDQLPFVKVTTSMIVRVPAPILLFDANFGHSSLKLSRSCIFPIVRTQLYL